MKADCAAFRRAPARMVKEAIWIRGTIVGRSSTFAMTPDRIKEIMVNTIPSTSSKSVPATITFFSFALLFSVLYCVVYFIVAPP